MRYSVLPVWLVGVAMLVPPAALGASGDAAKGKVTFDGQCALCHYADRDQKKMGPGMKGLFKKEKMANGAKPTAENVLKVINEGGNGMPAYKDMLAAADKTNLIRYLETL